MIPIIANEHTPLCGEYDLGEAMEMLTHTHTHTHKHIHIACN